MGTGKLTNYIAATEATDDDLLYLVDAPGGTPRSRKITVGAMRTSLLNDAEDGLDTATSVADEDLMQFVDDPSGTPTTKKITTANLRTSLLGNASAVTTLAESGTVSLGAGTQITLANLRLEVMPSRFIYVGPSGDVTGATDTAAIQAQLTALAVAGYYGNPGVIVLSGTYYINAPLTGGSATGYAICIHGYPKAQINWVGSTVSTYMLTMNGYYGRGWLPVLKDLMFDCDYKTRGVFLRGLVDQCLLSRIYIRDAIEVALDVISCWGSSIEYVTCNACVGIGMRTLDFNRGYIRQLKVRGYGCYHSSGISHADTTTLWKYEIDNTRDTETTGSVDYYGDDYISNWPAVDDTTVTDISGDDVVTLADERAGVILHGRNIIWDGGSFENSKYCEYPNIYILGGGPDPQPRSDSGMMRISQVWMESASNRLSRICWQGDEYGQNTASKGITIEKCLAYDTSQASDSCRAFLELRGATQYARVIDCYQQPCGSAMIYAADGAHVSPSVENAITYSSTLDEGAWIGHDAAATITWTNYGHLAGMFLVQDAPAVIADGDTAITAANLLTKILTMASSTTGRAPTVPTGTAINAVIPIGQSIDWTFINTGNQTVTITQATGHTLVGAMAITAGTQKSFRTRCSAANTAITYGLT